MTVGRRETAIVVVLALAAGAVRAVGAGEDANWDWQNYHEYNAWALLTGRYAVDVMPAGIQTYFNPVTYLPAWALRHGLPGAAGAMVMGAVHGLNLALIYGLTRTLLGPAVTVAALVASVLIAASGAQTIAEVGTSLADILTALAVVGGFWLLLRDNQQRAWDVLLGGMLVGVAVGLKPTNLVFAVGAAAAMLASERPSRAVVLLSVGGTLGAVIAGGPWGYVAWRDVGNPVFPLFNAFFHSPEVADTNILDLTFVPRSLWDGFTYPLQWLAGNGHTTEVSMRDARFAVLMLLVPVCIVVAIVRRTPLLTRPQAQLVIAWMVTYLLWLVLFSIHRYIVALELLCGPLIVVAIVQIGRALQGDPGDARSLRFTEAVSLVVAAGIALWVQPSNWWHRPWSSPYRPLPLAAELQAPATYFMLEKPLGYMVPRFPAQSRFFQIADIGVPVLPGGKFDQRIRAALAAPLPGGMWEMHVKGHPVQDALLGPFGVQRDDARPCRDIDAVLGGPVEACPLRPAG